MSQDNELIVICFQKCLPNLKLDFIEARDKLCTGRGKLWNNFCDFYEFWPNENFQKNSE